MVPSSFWPEFFTSRFQSFLVFRFLCFYLEDVFYHFHPEVGKPSGLSLSPLSKLFERIFLSRLLFFLKSNSILSSCQASFRCPGMSNHDQIIFLCQSILNEFNKSKPGSRIILAMIDSLKLMTVSSISHFFINFFPLASLLAFLVGLNFPFCQACLRGSSKT